MKQFKLKDFTRGWVVGDFVPSIIPKCQEVAIQQHKQMTWEHMHYHKESDEINIIIQGQVSFWFQDYHISLQKGDIIVIEKGQAVRFQSITKSTLLVIKQKSILGDKYLC